MNRPANRPVNSRPPLIPPQPARSPDGGPDSGPDSGLVAHMGVSWPRSGHHLLVRLLQLLLGGDFGYCQHYHTSPACCGVLPCTRPDIHLSKSHDFACDLPRDPARRHLIQWRAFLPAAVSEFELVVRAGGEDSRAAFLNHASHRFGAWLEFRRRWVDWGAAHGQLVLSYEQLTATPEDALARALAAIAPGHRITPAQITRALARVDGERIEYGRVTRLHGAGLHPPRDITAFRHYDPADFALLARLRLPRAAVVPAGTAVPEVTRILALQAGDGAAPLSPAGKKPLSFWRSLRQRRAP